MTLWHPHLGLLWLASKIFLCIPASAADAGVGNPNGIKTLLANGLITFFINGKTVFNNGLFFKKV